MRSYANTLDDFRRNKLLAHQEHFNVLKKEGDELVQQYTHQMKAAWERDCDDMRRPVQAIEAALLGTNKVATMCNDAAKEAHLNRLVDGFESLRDKAAEVTPQEWEANDAIAHYEPIQDRNALDSLTPWVPDWDAKVFLSATELKTLWLTII